MARSPSVTLSRWPMRTSCEGFTRSPSSFTFPPETAAVASERDLNRRTCHSHLSMRCRSSESVGLARSASRLFLPIADEVELVAIQVAPVGCVDVLAARAGVALAAAAHRQHLRVQPIDKFRSGHIESRHAAIADRSGPAIEGPAQDEHGSAHAPAPSDVPVGGIDARGAKVGHQLLVEHRRLLEAIGADHDVVDHRAGPFSGNSIRKALPSGIRSNCRRRSPCWKPVMGNAAGALAWSASAVIARSSRYIRPPWSK